LPTPRIVHAIAALPRVTRNTIRITNAFFIKVHHPIKEKYDFLDVPSCYVELFGQTSNITSSIENAESVQTLH